MAGLKFQDLGEETITDAAGGLYQGYRSHYKWDAGLTLRNWKYVVRIANIDVSDLTGDASGSSADIIDLMVQATEKLPSMNKGVPVFYCNATIRSFLKRQMLNKSNVNLTYDELVQGKGRVLQFDGIPVRRVDAILNTEATVS